MKVKFILCLFLNIFFFGEVKVMYYCPMHPSYTSDKPGSCLICGMDLVLKNDIKKQDKYISHDSILNNLGVVIYQVKKDDFYLKLSFPGIVMYDPELYKIINEYRLIMELSKNISDKENFSSLLDSIKIKLSYYGIDEETLKEVFLINLKSLISVQKIMFISFYVDEKYGNLLKKGERVKFKINNEEVFAEIVAVSPLIERSRKINCIAVFNNQNMNFKSNMYVEVFFEKNIGKRLLIPNNSYIEYGEQDIIYVKSKEGYIQRKIKTGYSNEKYTEVLSGLSKGEYVVVSSNFIIDSDTKIRDLK